MSLYYETAAILDPSNTAGGSLRTRIFGRKPGDLKSSPGQVYALAVESAKWSPILKEVIDNAQLLSHERKLTSLLALLLVHDFLLSKSGIALPSSHGLRVSIERHKARLTAEFSRARLRRKCPNLDALREHIEATRNPDRAHPRWIRVNTLRTTLDTQLSTTFKGFSLVQTVQDVVSRPEMALYIDENIPNLVAVSQKFDFIKSAAYKNGEIILQDKASCFPAYLLDPQQGTGDVIDSCAAPGNKTTHLAAILDYHSDQPGSGQRKVFAFEKDRIRANTLERMVRLAGSDGFTRVNKGFDFLKVDPFDEAYQNVGALLLDPSCSGSGIVGRDDMPDLQLPESPGAPGLGKNAKTKGTRSTGKRKREDHDDNTEKQMLVDDDGNTTVLSSEKDLQARLEALSSFQLTLLLHAFRFPSATRITYSTCSVHAEENEQVVLKALQSNVAKERGWRILQREHQVHGLRDWPVRGSISAADGDHQVADACIRTYKDDGRGVMGFFVVAFSRQDQAGEAKPHNGPCAEKDGSERAASRAAQVEAGESDHTAAKEAILEDSSDDAESDWDGFDD